MKTLCIVLLASFIVVNSIWSDEPKTADNPEPETVIRELLFSMLANDSEGGKKWILPNSDAEILWHGQTPPKEALPEIRKQIAAIPFKRLVVGETADLPGGKKLTVTSDQVNENRLMIMDTTEPGIPFILVKQEGMWKVDAGPIIAARKAAQRAMERQNR
jgi:hypothetical protein